MHQSSQENFIQPIISTVGIFVSLVSAISPIFSFGPVSSYFIYSDLAPVSGFIVFVFGLIVIWLIFEHFRFINVRFGKMKDRGRGFPESLFFLDKARLILLFLVVDIILAFIFISIKVKHFPSDLFVSLGIFQSAVYVLFFLIVLSIFTLLITSTIDRLNFKQERDEFPWIVFSTLEKNKLISTGIEFYENRMIAMDEIKKLGILNVFSARKITLKTIPQKREKIKVILSSDGKELISIIQKSRVA